ncbi:MAG: hypothetical protein KJP09_10495 [Bacteroidia bacterium]|nr:hypothetical protein [Bacteroidia bacterium]
MEEKKASKKWLKTIQILAAYLVAAWTFLQFVDWALNRYSISPYWVDLLLWVFIGIIPSLIIYLYNQDRINKRVLKLREKIIFPLNVLLIMVVTYFGFGNSDLGATTKEISYTDNSGELQTQMITKEEFRVNLPIFNFEGKTQDGSKMWMNRVINNLLLLDLEQDKNITPATLGSIENITDKVNQANAFSDYYVDGEFDYSDSIYSITPIIHNSKNGKELNRQTFTGPDFFDLIDEISIYVRDNVGIVQEMRDQYIDMDIKDFTTTSLDALKEYHFGRHDIATEIDPTFALAYYFKSVRGTYYSQGQLEEQYQIDRAYENRRKLPLQLQLKVLIQRHIAYNHWKEAEELVKLQLEIDPNDIVYSNLLYTIYSETRNFDEYLEVTKARYNEQLIPDAYSVMQYRQALLVNGKYEKVIDLVNKYQSLLPNNNSVSPFKTEALILNGDLEKARKNHNKTMLFHPDDGYINDLIEESINYQMSDAYNADHSRFFGEFRSARAEQVVDYFEDDNIFLSYSSNQIIDYANMISENKIIFTYPENSFSIGQEFQKNTEGEVYRIKSIQYYSYKNPETFWFYKENDRIKKADSLLKASNYTDAEVAYTEAISKHPDHFYLKDALAHIKYMKTIDAEALSKQYQAISGTYGARKFWVEDNKLFYKLGINYKKELLPISKNRYITLSSYWSNCEFEFLDDNSIASFTWEYDHENMKWKKLDDANNYILRDE